MGLVPPPPLWVALSGCAEDNFGLGYMCQINAAKVLWKFCEADFWSIFFFVRKCKPQ